MTTRTRDSINDIWGERTPHGPDQEWPSRVDEHLSDRPDSWVRGTCVLCSNGCGLDIGVKDGRIVGVRGLATDVTNKGRLGPKGLHGWVANHSEDRLTRPLIRRDGRLQEASWDEAMNLVVRKSREIIARHTSGAIGVYTTGQLFLEEYYTLAVIGKAGLGTPHMDGNTRLCTATAAAALKETFGSDGQPGAYKVRRRGRREGWMVDVHVGNYLGLVHGSEERLVDALLKVAEHHRDEPDVEETCHLLASWSREHMELLKPLVQKYGEEKSPEPANLETALFHGPREGGLGLLRDLHDLWLMTNEVQLCWTVLEQAARALRDEDLERTCQECTRDTKRQTDFCLTRIKQAAPQALVVA